MLISLNRNPAISEDKMDIFFKNFHIRYHMDYYFLDPNELVFFYNWNELEINYRNKYPFFTSNNCFDYIKSTYGYYSKIMQTLDYTSEKNNIVLRFQVLNLELDSGLIFPKTNVYKSFSLKNIEIILSHNLFSVTIEVLSQIETISFSY